jgi:hypothetical protein
MEVSAADASRCTETLKTEAGELRTLVKTRDSALAAMREQKQSAEVEADRLRVKAEHLQKDRNDYKTRAENNSSDVEKGLRVGYAFLAWLLECVLSCDRSWPFARYATNFSRTWRSRPVGTCSALNAWRTGSTTVCGNARHAPDLSTRWTYYRFISRRSSTQKRRDPARKREAHRQRPRRGQNLKEMSGQLIPRRGARK